LETAINYLQNEYNTSHHLLKTSLHYHVKHTSIQVQFLLYQFLIVKLSTPPLKFFKRLKKHITLLIYL